MKKAILYISFAACVVICTICLIAATGFLDKDQAETLHFTPISGTYETVSQPNGSINVNTAGLSELMELPGIGKVTAQKILDAREISPFFWAEDLKAVPGIGDKTLEKIRDLIRLEDE